LGSFLFGRRLSRLVGMSTTVSTCVPALLLLVVGKTDKPSQAVDALRRIVGHASLCRMHGDVMMYR
jgi:hypothetical protein